MPSKRKKENGLNYYVLLSLCFVAPVLGIINIFVNKSWGVFFVLFVLSILFPIPLYLYENTKK